MNIFLENDYLKVSLSSFAGHINRIYNKKNNSNHYWKYDSSVWPRRTSICFPICGSLPDNTYMVEGVPYTLPMHGFLRDHELKLAERDCISASFSLTSNDETKKIYPFDFRFMVVYELEAHTLIVRYIIKNTCLETMYFSVGAHYTYGVPIQPGQSYKNYRFLFDGVQNAGKLILENGEVTGVTEDIFQGRNHLPVDGLFGSGSTILNLTDLTSPCITIESTNSKSKTAVSFEGFSYVLLWAPYDGAPFVCIEPWAGMVSARHADKELKNKLGIVELESCGTRTYTQRIQAT